jgi:hypothetical protein
MPLIKAVVTIPAQSELPEDAAVNVWHFRKLEPAPALVNADYAAMTFALEQYYCADNSAIAGVTAVDEFLAQGSIGNGLPTVEFYLPNAAGQAGSPTGFGELISWAPGAAPGLPAEVAVCLSFHADLTNVAERVPAGPVGPAGDVLPRARLRNRTFLPFLSTTALQSTPSGVRPHGLLLAAMATGAAALRDEAGLAARDLAWCVYSKTTGNFSSVVGGWVDDAFDTQRRRGMDPGYREVF